jgi:hypothetical protein
MKSKKEMTMKYDWRFGCGPLAIMFGPQMAKTLIERNRDYWDPQPKEEKKVYRRKKKKRRPR